MDVRQSIGEIYNRWVLSGAKRLGVHTHLIQFYKSMVRWFGSSTVDHTVGDLTVSFPLERRWQHERFVLLQERELLKDLVAESEVDDIIYEVGAYVGSQTLVAAAATPSGEVVAFEPHPQSHERLVELVDWSEHDVTTFELALAADSETASMRDTGTPRASIYDDGELEIDTVRGDEFVEAEGLPYPTIVKLDVEGAEVTVLRGLKDQLSRPNCRLVYCELHPELAPNGQSVPDDIIALLESLGYDCELTRYGSKQFLKAKRDPTAGRTDDTPPK